MNQEEFEREFHRAVSEKTNANVREDRKLFCGVVRSRFYSLVPITQWLAQYSFKKNFHGDLVTGLTVGIMVVPQGMAYSTLAGVDPIYGLYSCLFSAFLYMFFGTSRHVSVGTFAVASMIVGTVQSDVITQIENAEKMSNSTDKRIFDFQLTPILVTTTLTFLVGICQIVMGLCRLSFLTNYISDPLVSGFTTGSAVHVIFSQLEKVIGVTIARQSGVGTIIKMFVELIRALPHANLWTIGISAFGLTFLIIGREYVNPPFKTRFGIPLPLELFLVIISIVFSRLLDINTAHNVKIIAYVPQGFPVPSLPKFDLVPYLWQSAITISVICYIFVFSMGKIFAKKHKYKLDSNQELYALGIAEIVSSFFPVYPCGASLSRSSLCEVTGARSQLHAFFSSALLLVVIMWLAPLLEPLPYASLACIVIVSLKGLFLQFGELPKLWLTSRIDFTIWLITFITTTLVDVTTGLLVGVGVVIFSVVLREQWPKVQRLHANPNQDIFRPAGEYTGLLSLYTNLSYRVIVLKFEAPLHFANCAKFIERCEEACAELSSLPVAVNALNGDHQAKAEMSSSSAPTVCADSDSSSSSLSDGRANVKPMSISGKSLSPVESQEYDNCAPTPSLIIDAACIAFIDSSGVDALAEVFKDGKKYGVRVVFAEFTDTVLMVLQKCNFFATVPKSHFYPTIKEALISTTVTQQSSAVVVREKSPNL